jgi:hypothetical protein
MERAMGIEPSRAVLPELENERFGAMANPRCDSFQKYLKSHQVSALFTGVGDGSRRDNEWTPE